jgi:hypothetical protein
LAIADFVKYSLLEGLADMISKDLEEPYLNISDKFFSYSFSWDTITEWYLAADQQYLGHSTIQVKYSWFTLLAERTVRKYLRPPKPGNRHSRRQDYPGLRAGPLYEDEISRWLGIDNYLVRTLRRKIDPLLILSISDWLCARVWVFSEIDHRPILYHCGCEIRVWNI